MKNAKKETKKTEPKKLTPEMKAELEKKAQIVDVSAKVKKGAEDLANKPKAKEKAAKVIAPTVKGKDLKKEKEQKAKKAKQATVAKGNKKAKAEIKAAKPVKTEKKEKAPKAAKKPKALSNIAIAEQLLKDKADDKTIYKAFAKVYKEKKDITDKTFITARAKIYMEIAAKNAKK